MRIDGNTLAKYLVMVSQVIAWCTVSMMLLRRGLNQVHGIVQQPQPSAQQQAPSHDNKEAHHQRSAVGGNATGDVTAAAVTVAPTTTAAASATVAVGHQGSGKPFDGSGTPAVVAGIVMIAIAAIMLIVSPVIMLLKIIEKRKNRILDAELESPPKYEDVVESAPRYSSLFVFNNDGEMTLLSQNIHKDKDNI